MSEEYEELYATKPQVILSLITTIIVLSIILPTLFLFPFNIKLFLAGAGTILLLIILDVFVYLSYLGKFPLYRIKRYKKE